MLGREGPGRLDSPGSERTGPRPADSPVTFAGPGRLTGLAHWMIRGPTSPAVRGLVPGVQALNRMRVGAPTAPGRPGRATAVRLSRRGPCVSGGQGVIIARRSTWVPGCLTCGLMVAARRRAGCATPMCRGWPRRAAAWAAPVVVECWAASLTWGYGVGMIGIHVCRAGVPAAGDRAVLARAAGPVLVGQGRGDTRAAARGGRAAPVQPLWGTRIVPVAVTWNFRRLARIR